MVEAKTSKLLQRGWRNWNLMWSNLKVHCTFFNLHLDDLLSNCMFWSYCRANSTCKRDITSFLFTSSKKYASEIVTEIVKTFWRVRRGFEIRLLSGAPWISSKKNAWSHEKTSIYACLNYILSFLWFLLLWGFLFRPCLLDTKFSTCFWMILAIWSARFWACANLSFSFQPRVDWRVLALPNILLWSYLSENSRTEVQSCILGAHTACLSTWLHR